MKRALFTFVLILLFVVGKTANFACEDDYKIINSTLVHLITISPSETEKEYGYNNFISKGNIPEDFIHDIYFTKYMISYVNIPVFTNVRIAYPENDEFSGLFHQLINNKVENVEINPDSITNVGFYRLNLVEKGQVLNWETETRTTEITYSRIIYDAEKTKAVFYFQNKCSGLCGFGKYVFVEKVDNIWIIRKEIYNWLS